MFTVNMGNNTTVVSQSVFDSLPKTMGKKYVVKFDIQEGVRVVLGETIEQRPTAAREVTIVTQVDDHGQFGNYDLESVIALRVPEDVETRDMILLEALDHLFHTRDLLDDLEDSYENFYEVYFECADKLLTIFGNTENASSVIDAMKARYLG